LVWLSIQRQARLRQMVVIALALLGLSVALILLHRARQATEYRSRPPSPRRPTYLVQSYPPRPGFTMHRWRTGRTFPMTNEQSLLELEVRLAAMPSPPGAAAVQRAVLGGAHATLDAERADFYVFSTRVLLSVFVSFLLPIWSLSFATNALGAEREGGNLVWLLSRPLNRPAVYLAKFVALLPWALALNLGGFALLCLASGRPGPMVLRLYWPAVLGGTLAFCALFHLMGAYFQRPAIVALVYSFFLETILGNMPGYMKRVSIGFYTRCMMFDAGQDYGVQPERPDIYLPVDGVTACWVLVGLTAGLLALGMYVFARKEYLDVA
jgi:hypothetical protein